MCGLSFAGKSTFASHLAGELPARIISLDAINAERGLYGGQGIPIAEWAATNRTAHERASAALADGESVIIDDTGSPRFIRDEWRKTAAAADAPFVIVWVRIDPELQRQRILANRTASARGDIVDDVLETHIADFEEPSDEQPVIVDADKAGLYRVAEVAAHIRQLVRR